jgi:hypothetical protein
MQLEQIAQQFSCAKSCRGQRTTEADLRWALRAPRVVVGMEEAPLKTALKRLVEAGILLSQGVPPESYYWFKHALITELAGKSKTLAYGSKLTSTIPLM